MGLGRFPHCPMSKVLDLLVFRKGIEGLILLAIVAWACKVPGLYLIHKRLSSLAEPSKKLSLIPALLKKRLVFLDNER